MTLSDALYDTLYDTVSETLSDTQPDTPADGAFEAAADCLFTTILGFTLPFYLTGAAGNPEVARTAILELINVYDPANAAELDLVGRLTGFGAAAMDNLRRSMQSGLSDAKVLHYRANAVALARMAEQGRKLLETMQAKRARRPQHVAMAQPMPLPKPTPVVPPRPTPPPRQAPPPPPRPPAQAAAAVEADPEFAIDIEVMKRNAHAMIADLRARAQDLGLAAPEASGAHLAGQRGPTGLAENGPGLPS